MNVKFGPVLWMELLRNMADHFTDLLNHAVWKSVCAAGMPSQAISLHHRAPGTGGACGAFHRAAEAHSYLNHMFHV
jgi:hypothetical protein